MEDLLPDVYVFNPTCEYAIANGNASWQPNHILKQMEADLSTLAMFLALSKDYVLVEKTPDPEFIQSFKRLDIEIPKFVLKSMALKNPLFINQPKNKLLPWGWSPSIHKFLSPLKDSCSNDFRKSPVFNWNTGHREITTRKFAADILKSIIEPCDNNYFIPVEQTPKVCVTKNDFEAAIKQWGNVMIKAPWSSSGRGLQPVTKIPVHQKVWEKILGIVNEQGYALVEPFLNKELDIALQFELIKGKVEFRGTGNFFTNKKGQYWGNFLNGLPHSFKTKEWEFATKVIPEIRHKIINALENSKMAALYEGFFGIDMLIYSDKENNLKINPCLEINARYTMGMLSIQLEKLLYKHKKGMFKTFYQPGNSFSEFAKEMTKQHPLVIKGDKIESGFFPLTETGNNSLFGAYIQV